MATKPKRGQANKRERVRTENVNAGFDNLRKLIPTDPKDRKLSKIEVLRLATSYINHLYNLTRASSCLEAETNDEERASEESSDEINQEGAEQESKGSRLVPCDVNYKSTTKTKSTPYHVCTFCLMMTKTTHHTPASTKRK